MNEYNFHEHIKVQNDEIKNLREALEVAKAGLESIAGDCEEFLDLEYWDNQTDCSEVVWNDTKTAFEALAKIKSLLENAAMKESNDPTNDTEIERMIKEVANNHTEIGGNQIFIEGAHFAIDLKREAHIAEGVRMCLSTLTAYVNLPTSHPELRIPAVDLTDWLEKTMKEKGVIK